MFTGLVEDVGQISSVVPHGVGGRLLITCSFPDGGVAVGDSVAVDGVCLTATQASVGGRFQVLAGQETLERTTVGSFKPGRVVNLERAMRLGDRLGGHLVQGHVDGVGQVESIQNASESWILWVRLPASLLRYVAEKGSLTIDGVSLTVNELRGPLVRLNLIPHSWSHTGFVRLRAGATVNIEVDVIARYVERLMGGAEQEQSAGLTLQRLQAAGFVPGGGFRS